MSNFALRILLSTSALFWLVCDAAVAESELRQTEHLQSRVVVAQTAAQPGTELTIGLLLEHDEHWHTYWRNPGDSGLKTEIELSVPDGVHVSGIDWPAPERFPLSSTIVNFGYGGRTLLPVRLSVPPNYSGDSLPISVRASWLICESECIPGKAEYSLSVPVNSDCAVALDARWQKDFARSALRQPRPAAIAAVLRTDKNDALALSISGAEVPSDLAAWTLFPVTEELITYSVLPQWQQRADRWETALKRSDYFNGVPERSDWLLVKGDRALMFTARTESSPADAASAEP